VEDSNVLGFGLLEDGRLVNLEPLRNGDSPLVFTGGSWVPFKGTFGELSDSRPVNAERAREIVAESTTAG